MTEGQIWFLIILVCCIICTIICARMCGNSGELWLYIAWALMWLALAALVFEPWVSLG